MTDESAPVAATAAHYADFAEFEARGSSPIYERLAATVAGRSDVIARLTTLPPLKRQANLVFAAMRVMGVDLDDPQAACDGLLASWDDAAETISTRSTQTNEAARVASFVPEILRSPEPIALVEVGASAGLCLFPDLYDIRYSNGDRAGDATSSLGIDVTVSGDVPRINSDLVVGHRVGLDLTPLDPSDSDDVAWLDALVWPEHEQRRERLVRACELAGRQSSPVVAGDLVTDLADVLSDVPSGLRTVVFHSAALAYVDDAGRAKFRATLAKFPDVSWLGCEFEGIMRPALRAGATRPFADSTRWTHRPSPFVLTSGGTEAVALAAPHGGWLDYPL